MLVFVGRTLGTLFSRVGVPEVVGEVLAGVFFGPMALGGVIRVFGGPLIELNDLMLAFSQMSAVIILFAAGLEFTFAEFRRAGFASLVVGAAGVAVPFMLGYQAMILLGFDWTVAMLVGAVLSATSIAVTVRVLEDLRQQHTDEAKIMVNAAVIDDVLGLAVLSVVASIVLGGGSPTLGRILMATVEAIVIWFVMLVVAVQVLPRIVKVTTYWRSPGSIEALATAFAFGLAALAVVVGLSPVVGAFAAGMALAGSHVIQQIHEYVGKLKLIFGPLFFAVIGTYLDLRQIMSVDILLVILAVSVAIVSKVLGCGIPAALFLKSRWKGLRVGLGMVSRGEVGFIVLGIGLTSAIIEQDVYSAMLLVVLATTIVSPILLKSALKRGSGTAVPAALETP